jgi:hypothetical protein
MKDALLSRLCGPSLWYVVLLLNYLGLDLGGGACQDEAEWL